VWILLFVGITVPLIVLAKSNQTETNTNRDFAEVVYKELTYKPEKLAPFPIGTPQCTTCVIKTQSIVSVSTTSGNNGQSETEESALQWIISHEGGPTSVNTSSLACGIAQSLPCSKLLSFAGVDMSQYNLETYAGVKAAISTVPVETQRAWMMQYIQNRYGSCVAAKQFWLAHGWY
jgi:hypothetical protein